MPEPTRYAVFAGDFYYPVGGWSDLRGIWSDERDAIATAEKWVEGTPTHIGDYIYHRSEYDWVQVVDLETHELIFSAVKENR